MVFWAEMAEMQSRQINSIFFNLVMFYGGLFRYKVRRFMWERQRTGYKVRREAAVWEDLTREEIEVRGEKREVRIRRVYRVHLWNFWRNAVHSTDSHLSLLTSHLSRSISWNNPNNLPGSIHPASPKSGWSCRSWNCAAAHF